MARPTLPEAQQIVSNLKLEATNISEDSYGGQLLLEARELILWLLRDYFEAVRLDG